ncbi:MAG: hypothetical protein AAF915_14005 [Cyanobacteria bacterium P01_D01_bin.50]
MTKKVKDHISGIAPGSLNAADTLFGIDAKGLKNLDPQALAALKDLQQDAKWWAKNGRKIQQQIALIAAGTAEKNVTLAQIAEVSQKYGKPIIAAKYKSALNEKKFHNFLTETKDKAAHQLGMENARHSSQMQFQQANQNLQRQIFTANIQLRANQLKLKADAANEQLKEKHQDFKLTAAMNLGSKAPFLPRPNDVQQPFLPQTPTPTDDLSAHTVGATATGRGLFGFISRGIEKVRKFFGI